MPEFGLPERAFSDILLENARLAASAGLIIRQARDIEFKNLEIKIQQGPPMILEINTSAAGLPTS